MATNILKISGTSATVYTVPSGKVAKVIINYLKIINNSNLNVGDYEVRNSTGYDVYTTYSGLGSATSNSLVTPREGWLIASGNSAILDYGILYIRQEHILVAGEQVTIQNGDISATVIEETIG